MGKPRKVTGLFRNKSGNGYGARAREDIAIPAGARLLLFKVREEDRKPNGPELELLVAVDEPGEAAVAGTSRATNGKAADDGRPFQDEVPF